MNVWHDFTPEKIKPEHFSVYITTSKGSNIKHQFEPESGLIRVTELLYAGSCYPFNSGIIPLTMNKSGLPMETIVLCPEPFETHTLVDCCPVGIIHGRNNGRIDEKILALPIMESANNANAITERDSLSNMFNEVVRFYSIHEDISEKHYSIQGDAGELSPILLLEEAMRRYQRKKGGEQDR